MIAKLSIANHRQSKVLVVAAAVVALVNVVVAVAVVALVAAKAC